MIKEIIINVVLIFSQNPGYMKDNFVIMIESFHIGDVGNQHNVSRSA